MLLEQHVLCALDDFDEGKFDSAILHACIAIDGTARKLFPEGPRGKKGYKSCLRKYYWLLERFLPAPNLEETKFSFLQIDNGHGKIIAEPDLADVIYHFHRCAQTHCEETSPKFKLTPSTDGYSVWHLNIEDGCIHIPDRLLFGLLGISVFTHVNAGIKTEGDAYLNWGSETLGIEIKNFPIKDSWGREEDLKNLLSKFPYPRVKLDFKNSIQEEVNGSQP